MMIRLKELEIGDLACAFYHRREKWGDYRTSNPAYYLSFFLP